MVAQKQSDTVELRKHRANRLWGFIQALAAAAIVGLVTWLFGTVDKMQAKIYALESDRKENAAQWRALSKMSTQLTDAELEIEVYKRLFTILIEQNRLSVTQLNLPKDTSATRSVTPSDYRVEQLQLFENEPQIRQGK